MPFYIDLNKSVDDNLVLASKHFGFEPKTINELVQDIKDYYSDIKISVENSKGGAGKKRTTYQQGNKPPAKYTGYIRHRSGLYSSHHVGLSETQKNLSACCCVLLGLAAAGAFLFYFIIPRYYSGGGEKNNSMNSEYIFVKTAKPLVDELLNILDITYLDHLNTSIQSLLLNRSLNKDKNIVSISQTDIDIVEKELKECLIKSKVKKEYNIFIPSFNTTNYINHTNKKSQTRKNTKKMNNTIITENLVF